MALAGWFLIHGHACFLFFVPVISCAVLAAVLWPRRHRPGELGASVRSFFATQRRVWVPVAVISVVFAFPIVLNLVLHWPGQFGDYLSYSSSKRAGGHSAAEVVRDALWYWWPYRDAWAVPVAGYAVAAAVTRWLAPARLRRFLWALLAVNAVSSLAFLYYASTGIDVISEHYVGYFYWSAPVITLLVIAVGVVEAMPSPLGAAAAAAAAVLALAALAVAPDTHTSTNSSDPAVLKQRPGHRPGAARCRVRARRALRRPDDSVAARPEDMAGRHWLPCAGRADRGAGVRCEPGVDVHDDQPVHLYEPGDRSWPALLVPHRCPAWQHGHRPAPAGRGDRRPMSVGP